MVAIILCVSVSKVDLIRLGETWILVCKVHGIWDIIRCSNNHTYNSATLKTKLITVEKSCNKAAAYLYKWWVSDDDNTPVLEVAASCTHPPGLHLQSSQSQYQADLPHHQCSPTLVAPSHISCIQVYLQNIMLLVRC